MYQLCKWGWRGLTTWKIPILWYLYTFWMQVWFKLTLYWKYFHLLRSKTHNTTALKNSKINRPAYINLTATDLYQGALFVPSLRSWNWNRELKDWIREFLWQLIGGPICILVSLNEAQIRLPSHVSSEFAKPMPIEWSTCPFATWSLSHNQTVFEWDVATEAEFGQWCFPRCNSSLFTMHNTQYWKLCVPVSPYPYHRMLPI